MRKTLLATGEYYHIFNRGTDKRVVFPDREAFARFIQGMDEFNAVEPIGSLYENAFRKKRGEHQLGNRVSKLMPKKQGRLVAIVCYCLNPNHYHFILRQITDRGIEKFMHRIGVGYTKYFNQRHERSGVLFQGPFKAIHVDSNEYLLHLSAYINLNNHVHQLGNSVSKSSWQEYTHGRRGFCEKEMILSQFKNVVEYQVFARRALTVAQEKKDMQRLLLE